MKTTFFKTAIQLALMMTFAVKGEPIGGASSTRGIASDALVALAEQLKFFGV